MHLSPRLGRSRALAEATFPLRRGKRSYTIDLRFMATESSWLGRSVAVYEFAGIDHTERQTWVKVADVRDWQEAEQLTERGRHLDPVCEESPPEDVLDLREVLLQPGTAPGGDPGS